MEESSFGILGLIPIGVALLLVIWKKQVVPALFAAILIGAILINGNVLDGFIDAISKFIIENSIADKTNASIIIFCLLIGGLIKVMSDVGGTSALADRIVKKAKSVKSTQLSTALLGIVIFFDDYANSIIVGNVMRPISDKQKISREKLAYIVDSTAAPISSIAPLSTWVAMEIGLIMVCWPDVNAMEIFIKSIPFRFYSLFALALVFITILTQKDFGAMLKAEKRARFKNQLFDPKSTPLNTQETIEGKIKGKVIYVVLPILIFILATFFGLWYNGYQPGFDLTESLGNSNPPVVLTVATFLAIITLFMFVVPTGKYELKQFTESLIHGMKGMIMAAIILVLAFALKSVIDEMELANWLAGFFESSFSVNFVSIFTFIAAFLIAFSTGTSWGTSAILMPIALPIVLQVPGVEAHIPIMVISAVLTGAVFGDHCSPISDTTIISSAATGSDHLDHVKTQLPYATLAGVVAIIFGFIPAAFGLSPYICLTLGILGLYGFMRFVGKEVTE